MAKSKFKKKQKNVAGRIDGQQPAAEEAGNFSKIVKKPSRKVLRKQARLLKKAKRQAHASHRPLAIAICDEGLCLEPAASTKDGKKGSAPVKTTKIKPKKDPEQLKLERNRKLLLEDNLLEDKGIKDLEKKLKINRRKKTLPRVLVEDGLDYILEICGMENASNVFDVDNMSDGGSDFDDDFASAMGKNMPPTSEPVQRDVHVVTNKVDSKKKRVKFDLTDSQSLTKRKRQHTNDDVSPDVSEELCAAMDDAEAQKTLSGVTGEEPEVQQQQQRRKKRMKSNVGPKEDIYGRLRDEEGNVITNATSCGEKRYVPPALRGKTLNDETGRMSEVALRLRRQLKGLLNRLSETNMMSISNEIEELYMKNIRNDMNESLVHLIFDAVVQVALTPERLVQEHAFLVVLLHANVGSEVGAHFLEQTAKKIDSLMKSGGSNYGVGKECDNVLLLLTHLYTFQVADSSLMYDVLRILADRFDEKDIDLILLVLRSAGFVLRKDDPVALKEMINTLQKKASSVSQESDQSRMKFMLETMMAIRNNNMRKIPNYDPTHMEHLRKLLRGVIHKGKSVVELKVSWADLIGAESKGRWWIVGSAWKNQEATDATKTDAVERSSLLENVSQDIITYARKQRMSTEDRKNIFSILMTAEDYIDAFEKLMHLGLKNQQERNIVYVVIDCCLQERAFNCFYAYLMNRFCDTHRKYKIMVQYAVWDRIRELQSATSIQLSNFAHLLSRLFLSKALSLSTLKIIEFADMNKTMVSFLRQILLELCLHEPEDECREAFGRLASQPKHHSLCECLRLFLELFMVKSKDKTKHMEVEEAIKLESRIGFVRKILTNCEAPVKL